MCGRYVSPADWAIERFWHIGAHNSGRWVQSFNVAPTTNVPMVRMSDFGEPEVIGARWGLIPPWWRQPKLPAFSFNARSEEADQKPIWRKGLRKFRCIMPARGWYEWQDVQGDKQPYFIHDADSDDVLALAGLWSEWEAPDGQFVTSCAVLTKSSAPAHVVAQIHSRMPVVLRPEQFEWWLSFSTPEMNVKAMIANARHEFTAYAVSTLVNNPRNDDARLLEPV